MVAATIFLSGTTRLGEDINDNTQRAFDEHTTNQAQRLRDDAATYQKNIAAYDTVLVLNLPPTS